MQLFGILRELRESRAFRRKPWLPGSAVLPPLSPPMSRASGSRVWPCWSLADIYRVPTDYLLGRRGANPELDLAGLSQQEIEALRVIVEAMRRD